MPAHDNLYPGVNAHLNSHLQQPDAGWDMFHARCVNELATVLDGALVAPYYATTEKSLQIRAYPDSGESHTARTVPDAAVYRTDEPGRPMPVQPSDTPTMVFPVAETFSDDLTQPAVVIYRADGGRVPGHPVTRLEVLSPGNKPPGSHHLQYLVKRQETLESGLRLVEVDLLHEARPFLQQLKSYADADPEAYPYVIVVSDPRPNPQDGKTRVFGVGVDAPLPQINVPLDGDDAVLLDIGEVYNRAFRSLRVFSMVVDYAQEPANFNRYTQADRERIRQRMATIAQT